MHIEQAIREIVAQEVAVIEKRLREELSVSSDEDLKFSEACEFLNMSEHLLRQLIRQKRIPHRAYGAEGSKNPRYYFSKRRLETWKREEEERNYVGTEAIRVVEAGR